MTDANLSQPSDTRTDTLAINGAVVALLVVVALIAGAASLFMSFHGLRDLVERVEGVEGYMSAVGPFGIDGLQLAALFAIVITAGAQFRVRLYLWIVFFGAIAVSVAMNCVDAAERHAGPAGVVLSGFWPALLAAATHVVVVAFRWWQSRGGTATAEATDVEPEPVERKPEPDQSTGGRKPAPTDAQIKAWARQRYDKARSAPKVAADMTANGIPVSAKQVERWTADMRKKTKAEPEPSEDFDAELADLTKEEEVAS